MATTAQESDFDRAKRWGKKFLADWKAGANGRTGRGRNGGVYPGVGRCFGQLAHGLDSLVFYIGFIRPLWQREHKTWADSITKTVVLDRSASGFTIASVSRASGPSAL